MSLLPFVEGLKSLRFENTFNPYSDQCPVHDLLDAPKRREIVLSALLAKAMSVEIDAIWIGRDLGHRGGRRTGLALTDDFHFGTHLNRWRIEAQRPTSGKAMPERTADIIWHILDQIDTHIFLWNVFPLHPHEPGNPFTNRQHNAKERRVGVELLEQLLILLNPGRIIAIGNDAAKVVAQIRPGSSTIKVRHPSYGGQTQFLEQMRTLYGLDSGRQEVLL